MNREQTGNPSDLPDDLELGEYGYQQDFRRTFRSFGSFAIAFSFISITTGIFTTFSFTLITSGPRGIWTWWIVIAGQLLVATVYGALSAKIPLSGYSYQWASRLAHRRASGWVGWRCSAFPLFVIVF